MCPSGAHSIGQRSPRGTGRSPRATAPRNVPGLVKQNNSAWLGFERGLQWAIAHSGDFECDRNSTNGNQRRVDQNFLFGCDLGSSDAVIYRAEEPQQTLSPRAVLQTSFSWCRCQWASESWSNLNGGLSSPPRLHRSCSTFECVPGGMARSEAICRTLTAECRH